MTAQPVHPVHPVHPAHRRIESGDLAVPRTRVQLTNGATFDRYCTAGPGSEPEVGLPARRAAACSHLVASTRTTPLKNPLHLRRAS